MAASHISVLAPARKQFRSCITKGSRDSSSERRPRQPSAAIRSHSAPGQDDLTTDGVGLHRKHPQKHVPPSGRRASVAIRTRLMNSQFILDRSSRSRRRLRQTARDASVGRFREEISPRGGIIGMMIFPRPLQENTSQLVH
jgi:hypothetical protein